MPIYVLRVLGSCMLKEITPDSWSRMTGAPPFGWDRSCGLFVPIPVGGPAKRDLRMPLSVPICVRYCRRYSPVHCEIFSFTSQPSRLNSVRYSMAHHTYKRRAGHRGRPEPTLHKEKKIWVTKEAKTKAKGRNRKRLSALPKRNVRQNGRRRRTSSLPCELGGVAHV
jgi:hypothetical protein